jgi:bifunctional UDP-N-acetylglucosamine pyrophosphorylase/glucosamine-1-phosphate N-acetyltransferase
MKFVRQEPQLGTGHAVQQAVPLLPDDGTVVVLSGDVPLTQADTLRALIAACGGKRLALLTIDCPTPPATAASCALADARRGCGAVLAIVEHKDATEAAAPASARSTPASWPCRRAAQALAGALTTTTPRASTT